ncbi:hypothetical protein C8R47DRAFT_216149 [Mycena vitilis]|nr:hypothetical protein C8R47DRAFT_216149 [Mycena vitilis]
MHANPAGWSVLSSLSTHCVTSAAHPSCVKLVAIVRPPHALPQSARLDVAGRRIHMHTHMQVHIQVHIQVHTRVPARAATPTSCAQCCTPRPAPSQRAAHATLQSVSNTHEYRGSEDRRSATQWCCHPIPRRPVTFVGPRQAPCQRATHTSLRAQTYARRDRDSGHLHHLADSTRAPPAFPTHSSRQIQARAPRVSPPPPLPPPRQAARRQDARCAAPAA